MAAKLSAASIRKAFVFYNERLFGGRLTEPKFRACFMKNDWARWYEPREDLPAGLMVLSTQRHPFSWRATLVHEMIHMAVPLTDADHHGPLFLAEANRVGALLGLEECDITDAWYWPRHHEAATPLDDSEASILDD